MSGPSGPIAQQYVPESLLGTGLIDPGRHLWRERGGQPFAYGTHVIPFLDVEVAPQKRDHGQVGRARVERRGEGLEDPR